jgi:hypothetical protein
LEIAMTKPNFTLTCGKRPKVPEGATHFVLAFRDGYVGYLGEAEELDSWVFSQNDTQADIIAVPDGSEIGRPSPNVEVRGCPLTEPRKE